MIDVKVEAIKSGERGRDRGRVVKSDRYDTDDIAQAVELALRSFHEMLDDVEHRALTTCTLTVKTAVAHDLAIARCDLMEARDEIRQLRDERDAAVGARDHASSDAYERGFRAGIQSRVHNDDATVERMCMAGERWFAEHPDGAFSDDEWRRFHRAVLTAALGGEDD